MDNHGGAGNGATGWDVSFDNYREIADPADYALSSADGSGAGSTPLSGAQYEEVESELCDVDWIGQCLPEVYPGATNASDKHANYCS